MVFVGVEFCLSGRHDGMKKETFRPCLVGEAGFPKVRLTGVRRPFCMCSVQIDTVDLKIVKFSFLDICPRVFYKLYNRFAESNMMMSQIIQQGF